MKPEEPEEVAVDADNSVSDLHHNNWLIPSGGGLEELAHSLFLQLEATTPRPAKVRRDAAQRRREMVSNLVANLAMLTAYCPTASRLAISARQPKWTRYMRPKYPSKAFLGVVEGLENLGLLRRQRGSFRGHRTALSPTERLREELPRYGETPTLARLRGEESIQLKAPTGRGQDKVLVDYADTPETIRMRTEMDIINSAINSSEVTLDGQQQPPVHLVRMFQVESPDAVPRFNLHGRIYWGFWEDLKKSKRPLIRIDGQQVAELDFSGMFARLAYAESGIPPPPGDMYEGLDMPREAAKSALSALLCRTGPMLRLPKDLKPMLDKHWSGPRVEAAMTLRHPEIGHLFGQGIGLRLMFTESRIMVATLLKLIERGAVGLPIHDGLLVPAASCDICAEVMGQTAKEITGFNLPVARR